VIERGERLARMVHVRIRHGWILAHDVHAADLALLRGMDGLDHGEARLGVELHAHSFSKRALASGVATRW